MELYKSYTDVEIISKLLNAVTQLHIYHFQSKSYSQHVALGVYDDISEKLDELCETIQGKTKSILKGYKTYPLLEDDNPIKFLEDLKMCLESYRKKLKSPDWDNIDNQVQVLVDVIETVIYKLNFLKWKRNCYFYLFLCHLVQKIHIDVKDCLKKIYSLKVK